MPASPKSDLILLQNLLSEGEQLLAARPDCHKMRNDMAAIVLMAKMADQGCDVEVAEAVGCIERMRIAISSGIYPAHLLNQPDNSRQEH